MAFLARFVLTHAKGLNHVAHEEARRRFLRSGGNTCRATGSRCAGRGRDRGEGRRARNPALREHDLEDVSGGDVVFGAADASRNFFLGVRDLTASLDLVAALRQSRLPSGASFFSMRAMSFTARSYSALRRLWEIRGDNGRGHDVDLVAR